MDRKKVFTLILLVTGLNICAVAQDSIWQGRIGSLRVVLKVIPDSLKKNNTVFFNFPDEFDHYNAFSCQKCDKDSICVGSENSGLMFKGAFSNDRKMVTGVFSRYKKVRKITLAMVDGIKPLVMPQTPVPPFPYISEDVIYKDDITGIVFGGTLTLPKQKKNCPAVIIVSGTGPQDRDGTMAGHKMFAVLADYLTRNGIAVLRVDDRGVGKTTGRYDTSTTEDFAKDVLTSIQFLKSRKEINPSKIGLIGHSEGGAVISIAASKSKDVAYLVSVAGLAMDGLDALRKQNADLVSAAPIPDYDKKRYDQINEIMFTTAYRYANSDSLEQKLNAAYNEWKKNDDEYFKTLKIEYDHFRFPIYRYVIQATGPWYRFFIQYNPAKYLTKVTVPILAINGDKDMMVSCRENLYNWVRYPAAGGNKKVRAETMPGLNHLFQHCVTGDQDEYSSIDETFAPEALKIIGDWILDKVK